MRSSSNSSPRRTGLFCPFEPMAGERLEGWTHEAVAEYRRLRDRLRERADVFDRNDAARGRNMQPVRATDGDTTTDDDDDTLYAGQITWRDATNSEHLGATCWILTEGGGQPEAGALCNC